MEKMISNAIGIHGSKDHLDAHRLADGATRRLANDPRPARRSAEATGKLAKTDHLDAAMLARMGAVLELQARPPRKARSCSS